MLNTDGKMFGSVRWSAGDISSVQVIGRTEALRSWFPAKNVGFGFPEISHVIHRTDRKFAGTLVFDVELLEIVPPQFPEEAKKAFENF